MAVNEERQPQQPPPTAPPDFQAVVASTSTRLYRLAARVLGSEADAEDVLQDAYLRAFEAWRGGGFDARSSIDTWLYRIVIRVAVNFLRTRRRSDAREAAAPAAGSNAQRALEARAELAELSKWLDLLPPDQRAALVLKELEGLSSADVAQVLECSVGAVEQRLFRARATLRKRSDHE